MQCSQSEQLNMRVSTSFKEFFFLISSVTQFLCQFAAKQIAEGLCNWKGLSLSLWWQACCSSNQGFIASWKKNNAANCNKCEVSLWHETAAY